MGKGESCIISQEIAFFCFTFLSLGKKSKLFPFDCARGLLGDVINDTVYAIDFIDDTAGHGIKKFPWKTDDLSGNGIDAVD